MRLQSIAAISLHAALPPAMPNLVVACYVRFALGLLLAVGLCAQTFPTRRGHINDFVGILDPNVQGQLEALSVELKQKTGAEVALAVVRSLEGDSVDNYANRLAEEWGVGDEQDRGALLLLAAADRQLRVEIGDGLEGIIPDGRADQVRDGMTPYLRQGDFNSAITLGISELASIVAQDAGVTLAGMPQRRAPTVPAQEPPKPFNWVNPLPPGVSYPGVSHHTFVSPSMKVEVGYCIYLPTAYADPANAATRYPVVYYLHGGRPGSEIKSVSLAQTIHEAIEAGTVPPAIYVWVNGGAVSHYNYPEKHSMGEDVFITELIPHIDAGYRTIAERAGRAIEGFSQGGRGTTRIMFKHPHLFVSAAPGGAGHATEKTISESGGRESETLKFAAGYNTYDLAREYAKHPEPGLNIMIHVGTAGFNYENNLAYMKFLDSLGIEYWKMIVPDVPHSATKIYEAAGVRLMQFHARNFGTLK